MGKKKSSRKKLHHLHHHSVIAVTTSSSSSHYDVGTATTATTTTSNSSRNSRNSSNSHYSKYNKIIQQLKSTDLKVRHSTLAALLHTTTTTTTTTLSSKVDSDFIGTTINSTSTTTNDHNNHKDILLPRNVLMAIRDQIVTIHFHPHHNNNTHSSNIMNQIKEQLYCCRIATECFNQYLISSLSSSLSSHDNTTYHGENDNDDEWLSGWILIFIQRIQEYILHYRHFSSSLLPISVIPNSTHKNHNHHKKNKIIMKGDVSVPSNMTPSSTTMNATTTTTTTPPPNTTTTVTTVDVLYTQFIEQCLLAMIHLMEYTPFYTTQRLQTYQQQQQPQQPQRVNSSTKNNTSKTIMTLSEMFHSLLLPYVQVAEKNSSDTTTNSNKNNNDHDDTSQNPILITTTATNATNSTNASISSHSVVFQSMQCTIVKCLYTFYNNNQPTIDDPFGVAGGASLPSTTTTTTTTLVQLLSQIIMQQHVSSVSSNNHDNTNTVGMNVVPSSSETTMTTINTILYSIGTLVSILTVSPNSDSSSNDDDPLREILTPSVQYVQQILSSFHHSDITTGGSGNHSISLLCHLQSTMVLQLQQSYDMYHQEQTDQSIDQQIIHEQYQKQESARTIAQRLTASSSTTQSTKTMMVVEETMSVPDAIGNAVVQPPVDVGMDSTIPSEDRNHDNKNDMDNDNTNSINGKNKGKKRNKKSPSGKTTSTTNHKSWDEMQIEWYNTVQPIQLSLDILLQWVSLFNCHTADANDEREISMPLSSSHMDVDDEYDDTMMMHMDDDNDHNDHLNSHHRVVVEIMHHVFHKCTIFRTIHELYTFLWQWYQSLRRTMDMQLPSTRIIRDTVSDLLCKTIIVMGQMFLCDDDEEDAKDRIIERDVVPLSLWNEFRQILQFHTTKLPAPNEVDEMMMVTTIPNKNDNTHTIGVITANASSTNNIAVNDDNSKNTVVDSFNLDKSFVQMQESVTSSMVVLLRSSNCRFGSHTPSMVLKDLIALLQHQNYCIRETQIKEPIVLRDMICMIGMILSSSTTTTTTLPESDIELATRALLQVSVAFTEPAPHPQPHPTLPTTTTKIIIVAVSDIDDDTTTSHSNTNSQKSPAVIASVAEHRKARLIVVMELLNVFMDIYSDDDKVGSMKYNLFYNHPHPNESNANTGTSFNQGSNIAMTTSVLNYYERVIPIMKQELFLYQHATANVTTMTTTTNTTKNRIRQNRQNDNEEHVQLLEVWHEILDNSIRFVQYKKEHVK